MYFINKDDCYFFVDVLAVLCCLCSKIYCIRNYTRNGIYYQAHSRLIEVPNEIPANAKQVDLSYNAITNIRPGAFSHLVSCTDLYLGSNALTVIRKDMWRGLHSFKTVVID